MTALLQSISKIFTETHDENAPVMVSSTLPPRKYTVLIIDDDPVLLQALHMVLYESGFEVFTSMAGPKGINTIRDAPRSFDAILLDYNLPGFNGARTLPYLRMLAPEAKIVCITGAATKDLPPELPQAVDKLIHKPFTSADLVTSLNALLRHA